MRANVSFVNKLISDGTKVQFVDVRPVFECEQSGVIEGAHILDNMPVQYKEGTTYIFYCSAGTRSLTHAVQEAGKGIKNIYSITGGLSAWAQTGNVPVIPYYDNVKLSEEPAPASKKKSKHSEKSVEVESPPVEVEAAFEEKELQVIHESEVGNIEDLFMLDGEDSALDA